MAINCQFFLLTTASGLGNTVLNEPATPMPQGMRNLAGIFMSQNNKRGHTLQEQLSTAVTSGTLAFTPPEKIPYTEPSLSSEAHLTLLESRGLAVHDRTRALHYLKYIGYFRLTGYAKYFREDGSDNFKNGTTFNNIFDHYKFDRKLRMLVMDVLKRIEIAIRVVISNHMSQKYGSHWFMDESHFASPTEHASMLDGIKSSIDKNNQEQMIKQYYDNHCEPDLPPSWIVCEIMSMGFWSRVYSNIKTRDDRNSIAKHFGLNVPLMESFLHCLTSVRNVCAHHGRLWNRIFSIKPLLHREHQDIFRRRDTLYVQLAIINIFINVIADGSSWKQRLSNLFNEYPSARLPSMGFPPNWKNIAFWGMNYR